MVDMLLDGVGIYDDMSKMNQTHFTVELGKNNVQCSLEFRCSGETE